MQTVVLAAGEGTRMRPLTARRPKPMLPVAGKPLLAHTVERAASAGASRVVVVTGYQSEVIRDHFGEEFAGVPLTYRRQERQRGTADAVRAARPALDEGPFAVLNGDTLFDATSLAALYRRGPAVASCRVENPSEYGVIECDDGRVVGITEKPARPRSDLVNAGAYVFPAEARTRLDETAASERGEHELTDVLRAVCETHDVRAVPFDRWLDVGRPWELLAANEQELTALDGRVEGEVSDDATLEGRVVVEEGARIREGVTVEGPALLRSGATVGPNAYVRGATLLESDVRVGHGAEVENSVLMAGATVGHLSYVGDSVLGRDVNLGAGTTVATRRHDGERVSLSVKGERVSTGRRTFGVVVGDGATTGVNTGLGAGVSLAAGARTAVGENVVTDR